MDVGPTPRPPIEARAKSYPIPVFLPVFLPSQRTRRGPCQQSFHAPLLICSQDCPSPSPLAAASGNSLKTQILALKEWGVLRKKGSEGGWILDPKMVRERGGD